MSRTGQNGAHQVWCVFRISRFLRAICFALLLWDTDEKENDKHRRGLLRIFLQSVGGTFEIEGGWSTVRWSLSLRTGSVLLTAVMECSGFKF